MLYMLVFDAIPLLSISDRMIRASVFSHSEQKIFIRAAATSKLQLTPFVFIHSKNPHASLADAFVFFITLSITVDVM
uniref:Uncharacterized protein n=1 Tax=Arundo donax TaxID=35708 RepID=A0A0A9EMU7_ARUDO